MIVIMVIIMIIIMSIIIWFSLPRLWQLLAIRRNCFSRHIKLNRATVGSSMSGHHHNQHHHQHHPHPHNLHDHQHISILNRAEELADGTRDRVTLGNLHFHVNNVCQNIKRSYSLNLPPWCWSQYFIWTITNVLSRLDRPVSGQERPVQRKRPLLHHLQDQPGWLWDIGEYNHLVFDDRNCAFCMDHLDHLSFDENHAGN